jgi:hypothetical protein
MRPRSAPETPMNTLKGPEDIQKRKGVGRVGEGIALGSYAYGDHNGCGLFLYVSMMFLYGSIMFLYVSNMFLYVSIMFL